MIEVFRGPRDLVRYRAWMVAHWNDGYILNRHWNVGSGVFRGAIHRTNCPTIQKYLGPPQDPLLDGRYKACSTDLDGLRHWGVYVHRAAPHTPPQRCGLCP